MAGGRTDRPREHGWVSVDLHDAGALLQDPVGQQARLLNARHLTDPAGPLNDPGAGAQQLDGGGVGRHPVRRVMEPASTPQRTTTSSQPPTSRRRAAMRCGQASRGRTRSARSTARSRQRRRAVQVPASS